MPDKPIAVVTGVGPGTGSAIVRRFAADFALSPWRVLQTASARWNRNLPIPTR
jgi:NAD(P)-dependent dehydrogenase (short-subunit alcohol dehydrogenase family)